MKIQYPYYSHLTIALFLILGASTLGRPASAQYAVDLGGPSFDKGLEVGVDGVGNAYYIGNFADTLDFDPGPNEYPLSNNNTDIFVASYDPAGDMRFAFKIAGNHASHEEAGDIAVAPDGSFVITGSQPFGQIDFDPDPNEGMTRTGVLFIAGYNADGKVQFAVSPVGGENTSSGKGHAVTLDEAGNVYATGAIMTSIDFDPADTTRGVVPNAGTTDVFVASYTSDGEYRYAYSFGGQGFDHGSGIAVDSEGNVFVAGLFSGDAQFDPGDADNDGDLQKRTSQNNVDLFLVSYDADGRFRFVYTYEGTTNVDTEREIALSIDASDNIYLSGETHGTVAFDPEDADGDGNLVNRIAEPLGSAFLASYTSSGILRYATVLQGGASVSTDVYTNAEGTSFITGTFTADVDFDPGAGESILSSRRGADVFVASYDSMGVYRQAFNLPSTGLSTGEGVAVDSDYNVVVTGGFNNDLDVAHDFVEDWRASAGQNDIFMSRYEAAGEVSVSVEESKILPVVFDVSPSYPNPFTTVTTFALDLPQSHDVQITVFDVLGRQVEKLHEGRLASGKHQFSWNGGREKDGLYFIRVGVGEKSKVLRAVLVR